MPPILVLTGPTACGKTAAAIELARELDGEVVSADSVMVYRGFDIGSAKPSIAERSGVPHHLIDILDATETIDAAEYARRADAAIAGVLERRRLPIVAGGTGLWLRALLRGLVPTPPVDAELRARLELEATERGVAVLHERLRAVDPGASARIHPNDRLRIVRALEVFEAGGVPLGELQAAHALGAPRYDAHVIVLDLPKAERDARIEARTRAMIDAGLVDETRALLAQHPRTARAFGSLGYAQVLDYVEGRAGLEETAERIASATRVYARRQGVWWRSEPGVTARMRAEELTARDARDAIARAVQARAG